MKKISKAIVGFPRSIFKIRYSVFEMLALFSIVRIFDDLLLVIILSLVVFLLSDLCRSELNLPNANLFDR